MAYLIQYSDGVMIEVARKTTAQPVADAEADKLKSKFESAVRSVQIMLRPLHESVVSALAKSNVASVDVKLGLSFTAEGSIFFTGSRSRHKPNTGMFQITLNFIVAP